MADPVLDTDERNKLVAVLRTIPDFASDVQGRKAFMKAAGLGRFDGQITLTGSDQTVAGSLVDVLNTHGFLRRLAGEPASITSYHAVGKLLAYLLDHPSVGAEDAKFLATIIVQHGLVRDLTYIDSLRNEYGITIQPPASDDIRRSWSASLVSPQEESKPNQIYQPIPNPYYSRRPLPTGSPLFFGREDVFAFIAGNVGGLTQGSVLVLIGQRRSGKTSLLKQLPLKLDKRHMPVYIDGHELGIDPGMANLFCGLSQVITSSLALAGMAVVAPTREEFEPAPSMVFEQLFLARVEAALGDRRLLLAFDEFEEIEARVRDGNVDRTVFPFLRHLMQHSEKLAFVFVGTHRLEELSKDYWSIFFNIALYKQIRFLDDEAARRLIREPVAGYGLKYDDLAVERILDVTGRHPFFVQLMCHSLVNFANANRRNFITVDDVNNVVDETITLGEAHFWWLWESAAPKEKLVMAVLAELLRDQATVPRSAISGILADQRRYRLYMEPSEVSECLERLVAQGIIEGIPDHIMQYRFKLEILSLWIRRNRPLSQVIDALTVRAAPPRQAESGQV